MLLAQLLQESDTTASTEADLISVLRSQVSSTPPSVVTRLDSIDATLKDINLAISRMSERVSILEETCKSQAGGLKRRHDDQEDPDHREGEKRPRLSETATVSTIIPEATPEVHQEPPTAAAETATTEAELPLTEMVIDMDISDDDIPTVEKPEGSAQLLVTTETSSSQVLELLDMTCEADLETENAWYQKAASAANLQVNLVFPTDEDENIDYDQFLLQNFYGTSPIHQSQQPEPTVNPDLPTSELPEPPTPAPQPPIQPEKITILIPHLEEYLKKVYVHRIRKIEPTFCLGIYQYSPEFQRRYIQAMKRARPVSEVYSKHPIREVLDIRTVKVMKILYPVFTVRREDGNEWIFSEADFSNLRLIDFLAILKDLRSRAVRPIHITKALESVRRFMVRMIMMSYLTDFQMAVENRAKKVNLLKPNLEAPELKMYPENSLLLQPEFGIVYLNDKQEKRFLRFSQVDRFCDGTLLKVRHALRSIIQTESENQRLDYVPNLNEINAREALSLVEDRLEHRVVLRRFEVHFALRKRYVFNWQEIERTFDLQIKGGDC